MSGQISENDRSVLHLITNPGLPMEDAKAKEAKDDEVDGFDVEKLAEVKELEKKGVVCAEDERYEEAMEYLQQAISLLPTRASAYNNRAQLHRLMGNTDGAMDDLNKAIELTQGKGRTASFAYTQRALLLKKQGEQEKSLQDFEKAAQLGNPFAKREVIQSNPYAALCNQMLSKAFQSLSGGCDIDKNRNEDAVICDSR